MKTQPKRDPKKDDFQTVARRLECDPDMEAFDEKLKKIAKAQPPSNVKPTRRRPR